MLKHTLDVDGLRSSLTDIPWRTVCRSVEHRLVVEQQPGLVLEGSGSCDEV